MSLWLNQYSWETKILNRAPLSENSKSCLIKLQEYMYSYGNFCCSKGPYLDTFRKNWSYVWWILSSEANLYSEMSVRLSDKHLEI